MSQQQTTICQEHNVNIVTASCRSCHKTLRGCKIFIVEHSNICRSLFTCNKRIVEKSKGLYHIEYGDKQLPSINQPLLFIESQSIIKKEKQSSILIPRKPLVRKASLVNVIDGKIVDAMQTQSHSSISDAEFDKHLEELIKLK